MKEYKSAEFCPDCGGGLGVYRKCLDKKELVDKCIPRIRYCERCGKKWWTGEFILSAVVDKTDLVQF